MYQAMGFKPEMFTVLFAIPRAIGWLSQWQEMLTDPEQKIARPRQGWIGHEAREFVAIEKRGSPLAWGWGVWGRPPPAAPAARSPPGASAHTTENTPLAPGDSPDNDQRLLPRP